MGIILAFDLDQTLIDSTTIFDQLTREEKKPQYQQDVFSILGRNINRRLIQEVLQPAVKLRGKGVDAILLLTNNSSREYVSLVCKYLYTLIQSMGRFPDIQMEKMGNSEFPGVANVFDYVMVRQHSSRPQTEDPPKKLKDIDYMLRALNILTGDIADLAKRTFFFDDRSKHIIRSELSYYGYPNHYIQIMGPDIFAPGHNKGFIAGKPDLSDYSYITRVLSMISRGEDPSLPTYSVSLRPPLSKPGRIPSNLRPPAVSTYNSRTTRQPLQPSQPNNTTKPVKYINLNMPVNTTIHHPMDDKRKRSIASIFSPYITVRGGRHTTKYTQRRTRSLRHIKSSRPSRQSRQSRPSRPTRRQSVRKN
jgi:hypothetical protein